MAALPAEDHGGAHAEHGQRGENRTGHRMFAKDKAFGRIDGIVSEAMSIGVATLRSKRVITSPWDDPEFSLVPA